LIHRIVFGRIILLLVIIITGWNGPVAAASPDYQISIVAGGDVMLGSWVEDVVRSRGWSYPFMQLDSVLQGADAVFANLEAPFGMEDSAFEKTYTFQVSPDLIQVLTAGKINVVSLANNHILDYGEGTLIHTINLLKGKGIAFSGAGRDLSEARQPALLNIKDHKLAFASYSLTFPEEFWATDSTAGTCFPFHTFFYRDIKKFKKENDLVIVSFHWGGELMNTPKEYQIQLAHQTIDAGADLIIGHHPHVVQGLEIYKDRLIFYSLGNFIFGSYSQRAIRSMLINFYYGTGEIKQCRIYPINVNNAEVEFQPRLLQGEDKIQFINELNSISGELNNKALVINSAGLIQW
jgi:poly-gamma-glutamate capsule biosynthesis protein CapA/YwtB (metallophosphatase superfamily)